MKCSFRGCSKEAFSKGLCGSHYQQQRKGQPLKPLQVQYHGLSENERFDMRVNVLPSGCWEWTASTQMKTGGYGQFRTSDGRMVLAHRFAFWRATGKKIDGWTVCHKCDNVLCVNPDHLFLGTQADNVADMWKKGRASPGVSRGEDHGNSKLTEALVHEIRDSAESGPAIASRLGISTTQVYDVRNRKVWKHID